MFPTTRGQPGSSLLYSGRRLHGRRQQQRLPRHGWISAVTASFVVASLQAQTSLALASFSTTASVRKVDVMMTRRNDLTFLPRSSFTVMSTSGHDRSLITGWFPLSRRRQTTVTQYFQNGNHESSNLKGHRNDDNHHDAKRYSYSSSTTPGASKDYNKLPRLYVGDRHSSSVLSASTLGNALLFNAKDWQTTPLYELLLQASRADNKQVQQQQQQQHSLLLTQGATLSLNADQSHYLTTVLRLHKKKNTKMATGGGLPLVRIFDETGEWLAEVEPIMSIVNDPASSSNSGNKKNKNQQVVSVTCLQQLRQGQQHHKRRPDKNNSICWMAVALPKKKDRSRWLIEKCTELGVAGFILLDTAYSESRDAEATGSKLLTYAMEAAEQSERLDLPSFVTLLDANDTKENYSSSPDHQQQGNVAGNRVGTTTLTTLLDAWLWHHKNDKNADENDNFASLPPPDKPFLLACRERIDHSVNVGKVIREQILNQIPSKAIVASDNMQKQPQITLFVVGPEGGWSPEEQARFDGLYQEQQSNASAAAAASADGTSERKMFMWNVSLGPNILRAETAAVTAAAAHALVLDEFDSNKMYPTQQQVV